MSNYSGYVYQFKVIRGVGSGLKIIVDPIKLPKNIYIYLSSYTYFILNWYNFDRTNQSYQPKTGCPPA